MKYEREFAIIFIGSIATRYLLALLPAVSSEAHTSVLLYFVITNLDSHKVQLLALVGGDGALLVVVFPRSEHQQSPFCAGIKLIALWFCQWCEAVFNQHDGG